MREMSKDLPSSFASHSSKAKSIEEILGSVSFISVLSTWLLLSDEK
jgi:hypothetical protein